MTKLYTLAAACGATNAYENSPKIGFDPEAWAKFEEALTPSGLPQPQTVADERAIIEACDAIRSVKYHPATSAYGETVRAILRALSAPAVETVAEQPGLIALAEKCSAEVGRYEGEVVWVKFHSQAAIEAFATGVVMSAAVRSHAKPVAPKAEQAATQAEAPAGWQTVIANARLGLAAGGRSVSGNDFEIEFGGALIDGIAEQLELLAAPTAPTGAQAEPTKPTSVASGL